MNTKEKHIRENESAARRAAEEVNELHTPDQIADSMPAEGRNRKRVGSEKSNRLWIWLGVLILIFIIVWWLFSIGTFEDIIGSANG